MRLAFGSFRQAARDPSVRRGPPAQSFPTPIAVASSAIRRYHSEGEGPARRALDRGLGGYWSEPGSRVGWANAIRLGFDNYIQLASADPRPAAAIGIKRDISVPPHVLGVYADVVMLDEFGYVGRLALWDSSDLTEARARLYAAPIFQMLQAEMGQDRVHGIEIWKLRTREHYRVGRSEAEATFPTVVEVVSRYFS